MAVHSFNRNSMRHALNEGKTLDAPHETGTDGKAIGQEEAASMQYFQFTLSAYCNTDGHRRRQLLHEMTLIELLVSFSIIGLLVAVLLMGVQFAREASRRTQCVAKLHQIGLAIANYESSFKVLPPGLSNFGSTHVSLLPFIEQQDVYDEIVEYDRQGLYGFQFAQNLPVLSVYVCPSDPARLGVGPSESPGTNYAGNSGTWLLYQGFDGFFRYWLPASQHPAGPIRSKNVPDGLSQTAAMSEILRSDGNKSRLRTNWNAPSLYTEIDVFANACNSLPSDPHSVGWNGEANRGVPWNAGDIGVSLYNHVLTPSYDALRNKTRYCGASRLCRPFHHRLEQLDLLG